ncbi:putative Ubiquitin carboxyl-terminal hydrolase [Blattamonas nauphoetae]|uniref:ubiquitinyl hydrolase 1 n=1 Tax=Blattamonas nauphoetae TaxID=2049346 RepID=A0ABQ9XRG4_9EUKA|nr:putative Ubiquitin carboxyl-terminal hydrolase [Blattamonas nauphoetae]
MMYWVCAFKFDRGEHLFENSSFISKKFDLNLIWNGYSSLRIDPVQHRSSHQGSSNIHPISPSPPSDIFYLPPKAHTLDKPFNYSSDSQKTIQNKHCVNPNQKNPAPPTVIPANNPQRSYEAVYPPLEPGDEPNRQDDGKSLYSVQPTVVHGDNNQSGQIYDQDNDGRSFASDAQTMKTSQYTLFDASIPSQTAPSPTHTSHHPSTEALVPNLSATHVDLSSTHHPPSLSVDSNQSNPPPNNPQPNSSENSDYQQASSDEVDTVIQADNGADWNYNSEQFSERSDLTSNSSQPTAQYEPNANAPNATGGVLTVRVAQSSKTVKESEDNLPALNEPNPTPHISQPINNTHQPCADDHSSEPTETNSIYHKSEEPSGDTADSGREQNDSHNTQQTDVADFSNASAWDDAVTDDAQDMIQEDVSDSGNVEENPYYPHQPSADDHSDEPTETDSVCHESEEPSGDTADSGREQNDSHNTQQTDVADFSNASAWDDAVTDDAQDMIQEDVSDSGNVEENPYYPHQPSADDHSDEPTETDSVCHESEEPSGDTADSGREQNDSHNTQQTDVADFSNASAWDDAVTDDAQDMIQEDVSDSGNVEENPYYPHQPSADDHSDEPTETDSVCHESEEPSGDTADSGREQNDSHNTQQTDVADFSNASAWDDAVTDDAQDMIQEDVSDSGNVEENPYYPHQPSADDHSDEPTETDSICNELNDATRNHTQEPLTGERISQNMQKSENDRHASQTEVTSVSQHHPPAPINFFKTTTNPSRRVETRSTPSIKEIHPGTDLQNVQPNTSKPFVWKDKQMEADQFRLQLLREMAELFPPSQWNPSSFNVYPLDISLPFSNEKTKWTFPSIPAKRRPMYVIHDPNHIRLEINNTFLFGHFENFIHNVLGQDYPFPFQKNTQMPLFSQLPVGKFIRDNLSDSSPSESQSQDETSPHSQEQTPAIPWMGAPLVFSISPQSETELHQELLTVNWPIQGSDILNEIMNDIEDFSQRGTLEQECYQTMSIIPITLPPTDLSSSYAYKSLPNILFVLRCFVYTQELCEQDTERQELLLRDSSELLSHLLDSLEEHCPENDHGVLPLALHDCMLLFLQASTTENMTKNISLSQLFICSDNTHPKSTHFYVHLLQKQLDNILFSEGITNPSTCVVRSLHSPTTLFVLHRLSHLFQELLKTSDDISHSEDMVQIFSSLIEIIPIVVEHEQTTFEQRVLRRTDIPNLDTIPDDTENLSPLYILLNLAEIVSRNLKFEFNQCQKCFAPICSLFSSNQDIPHIRSYSIPIKRIAVTLSCRLLNQFTSLPKPQPNRQRQLGSVGLKNHRETCYLAVTIQLLIHIPQFYHLISHIDETKITDVPIPNTSANITYRDLVHNLKTLFSRYSNVQTASIPFEEANFFKTYHPIQDSSLFYLALLADLRKAFQMADLTQHEKTINTCFQVHSVERTEENEPFKLEEFYHRVPLSNGSLVDYLNKADITFKALPQYMFIDLARVDKKNPSVKTDERIEFPYGTQLLSLPMGEESYNYILTAVILHSGRSDELGHFQIFQKISMGRWLCLSDETISEVEENSFPDRCFGGGKNHSSAKFLLYTKVSQDEEALQQPQFVTHQPPSVNRITIDQEIYDLFEGEMVASFEQGIPVWLQDPLNKQLTILPPNPLGNLPLECAFRHLNKESFKETPLSLVSSFTTKLKGDLSKIEAQQIVNLSLCLLCNSCDGDSSSLNNLFGEMEHKDSKAFSKLETWKLVDIIASYPELLTDPDVINPFYSALASILEDQSQLAMLFTFTRLFTNQFHQATQSTILCNENSASAFLSMALESGINKSINPTQIMRLWTAHPDRTNTNLQILLRKASRMRLIPTFVGDLVQATFSIFGADGPMSQSDFEIGTVAKLALNSSSLTKFFFKFQKDLLQLLKSRPSIRAPIRDILYRTVLKDPADGIFPPYDEMYNAYKTAVDDEALKSTFKRDKYLDMSQNEEEISFFNKHFPLPHDDEAISDIWRLFFLLTFGNHKKMIQKKLPANMQDLFRILWTQNVHSDWNLKSLHIIFTVTLWYKDRFLKVIHDCFHQFRFPVHPTPTQAFLILSVLSAYDLWIQKSKYQSIPKPLKLLSEHDLGQNLYSIIRTLVDYVKPKEKNVRTFDDHLSDNIRELLLSITKHHPSDKSNILRETMLRVLSELDSVDSFLVSLLFYTLCKIDYNSDISHYPLQITRSHPIPLLIALTNSLSEHTQDILTFAQITANLQHESSIFGTIPIIFTAFFNAMDPTALGDLLKVTDSPSIPYKTLGEVLLVLSHPLFHPQIRSHSLQFLMNLLEYSLDIQRMLFSSIICAIIPDYSKALVTVQDYTVGSESSPPTLDMDRSIIEQYLPDAFIFPHHNHLLRRLPSLPLLLSSSPSVLIGGKYIGLDVTSSVDMIRDKLLDEYLEKLMTSDPVWVVVFCAYFFKFCDKMPFFDRHKEKVEKMLFNQKLWENFIQSLAPLTNTQLDIITEIVKREDLSPNNTVKGIIELLLQ